MEFIKNFGDFWRRQEVEVRVYFWDKMGDKIDDDSISGNGEFFSMF